MYSSPGATSWASQILSNSVLDMGVSSGCSAPSQTGADHRQQHGLLRAGVLEVVGQIGVEGDTVAGGELVGHAVALQHDTAGLHQGALPAAGLMHGRIARRARDRAGRERV